MEVFPEPHSASTHSLCSSALLRSSPAILGHPRLFLVPVDSILTEPPSPWPMPLQCYWLMLLVCLIQEPTWRPRTSADMEMARDSGMASKTHAWCSAGASGRDWIGWGMAGNEGSQSASCLPGAAATPHSCCLCWRSRPGGPTWTTNPRTITDPPVTIAFPVLAVPGTSPTSLDW